MGDYETVDFSDNMKTPLTPTQNGGLQTLKVPGYDNPAFRLYGPYTAYTITPDQMPDGYMSNHLVFDKSHSKPDDTASNFISTLYRSSGRSTKSRDNYAITKQPATLGYSTAKSVVVSKDVRKIRTLGYSSGPSFAYMFSTSQRSYPGAEAVPVPKRYPMDRKEGCISFFDIETDKVSSYQYRPGEEISGAINIIVRQNVEIRYVELVVTGQGHMTIRRSHDAWPQTLRETYLHKQKCVIGSSDAAWTSVLTPGHYTSKYRVKLPKGLPSTIHHEDATNGFSLDITYTLKARIVDDGVSARPSRHSKIRTLMEKQFRFNIQRSFDLGLIPEAMSPIIHTEQVYLSCTHQEAAIVSVNLDRAVFLAGDDIKLSLQVSLPSSQKVKEITCKLIEHLKTDPKSDPVEFTLSRMIRKDPYSVGKKASQKSEDQHLFHVTIPTQTELLSAYSLGNSQIKVEYFLAVELRFTPAGGKLFFKVPIGMGPCAEPIYAEKTITRRGIPLFNRPMRFPCFSSRSLTTEAVSRPSTPRSAASVNVKTKYSNGFFSRCFLCCMGAAD